MFGAVDLEQQYPSVGNVPSPNQFVEQQQLVSGKQQMIGLIKYFSNWAIIIAALSAIFSLIYAGVMYLTSTGKPEKARAAKSRFYNALVGLTIIAGAYLVMVFINPKLTILDIKKVPVSAGIVLFTRQGLEDFKKVGDEYDIKDLVDAREAYLLTYSIPDLTQEKAFGKLKPDVSQPGRLDFENFPLYAIGFWGQDEKSSSQVEFYSQPGFVFDPRNPQAQNLTGPLVAPTNRFVLSAVGLLKNDGSLSDQVPVDDSYGLGIKVIKISGGYFKSPIEGYASDIIHPPLSIKIKRNIPGIYLSSSDGKEIFFNNSVSDLGQVGFDFDKKASQIKIVNERKIPMTEGGWRTIDSRNFLAILRSADTYSGTLRMFFEKQDDVSGAIPKIGADDQSTAVNGLGECTKPAEGNPENNPCTLATYKKMMSFHYYDTGEVPAGAPADKGTVGNVKIDPDTGQPQALNIAEQDRYGNLKTVSSAQVFDILPAPGACQEVRLCTEKQFGGKCLVYSVKDFNAKSGEPTLKNYQAKINEAKQPMPLYVPVNIPKKALVVKEITGTNSNQTITFEEQDFEDNFKSVKITPEGVCAVVLLENGMEFDVDGSFKKWKSDSPGDNSEVLIQSEPDLGRHPISLCGSGGGTLMGTYGNHACASAIAVFPIVREQVEPRTGEYVFVGGPQSGAGLPASGQASYNNLFISGYSDTGSTACGVQVQNGVIATDPNYIPLGSVVSIELPASFGGTRQFHACDIGGAICVAKTRRVADIWFSTDQQANSWGVRPAKITITGTDYDWCSKATADAKLKICQQGYTVSSRGSTYQITPCLPPSQ
ncbi:MAG: 3D domain-containing protein [Patescibacteria group bacterium]|nr:3D domain-containing protein [Patescibacteria group bacterium]